MPFETASNRERWEAIVALYDGWWQRNRGRSRREWIVDSIRCEPQSDPFGALAAIFVLKEVLGEKRPPEELMRLSRFLSVVEQSPFEAVHNRRVLAAEVENLFKELASERP